MPDVKTAIQVLRFFSKLNWIAIPQFSCSKSQTMAANSALLLPAPQQAAALQRRPATLAQQQQCFGQIQD